MSFWTKVGPCLDFYLTAEFVGALTKLLENARWTASFPQRDVETDCVDVDWHALAGSRYRRACSMLSSDEDRFSRALLAVVMEPLRHIHSSYLKNAHTAPDDMSWPRFTDEL